MNWIHSILAGIEACCFGVISFVFWRSLLQEMRLGKVHDLHWQVARLLGASLLTLTALWESVASPRPGTTTEYVRLGIHMLANAAFVYGMTGRRPSRLR